MKPLTLVLESDAVFFRAGLVQARRLIDLRVDRLGRPPLYRSVWRGKIDRPAPKGVYVALGGSRQAYLEGAVIPSGDSVVVEIIAERGGGKADSAQLRADLGSDGEPGPIAPDLVTPGWDAAQRLIADCGAAAIGDIVSDKTSAARFKTVFPDLVPKMSIDEQPFEIMGLEEELELLGGPLVPLETGGALSIETNAALTAIDVDTGAGSPAETVEAALVAIARQLRLRNISGIVLADLTFLKPRAALEQALARLAALTRDDPAGVKLMGLTPLGLIELTRRRRDRPLAEILEAK